MSTSVLGISSSNTMNTSTLYIQGTDIRNLFVSRVEFNQQNAGGQAQLQNYVTTTALNTTLAGYQQKINSSNKISYTFISDQPNLAIYATSSALASYVTNSALATSLDLYQTKK